MSGATFQDLNYSLDRYSDKFYCDSGDKLRGICSKHQYNSKEDKDFKIVTPAIILTNENYKVIQIKKNLDVYLGLKE
jgi:hypothetical protein